MKKILFAVVLLAGCASMPENVKFASSTDEVAGCEYTGMFRNDMINDGAQTSLNSAATYAAQAGANTLVIVSKDASTSGSMGDYGYVGTSHSAMVQGYKCSQ